MRRSITSLSVGLTLFSVLAPGALAQADGAKATGAWACFRGRPEPRCASFWIFELQGVTALASSDRARVIPGGTRLEPAFSESTLEWNLGHMVNLTPRLGVGGVVTVSTGVHGGLGGLRARARWWLNEAVSAELEAGVLHTDLHDSQFPAVWGPSVGARMNISDYGSIFLRYDTVELEEAPLRSATDARALSLGVGLGSVPALIGTGALGVLYAVLLGSFVANSS